MRSPRSDVDRNARFGVVHTILGQLVVAVSSLAGLRLYTEMLDRSEFGVAMMAMGGVALLDGAVVMALNQTLLSISAEIDEPERSRQVSVGLSLWAFGAVAVWLAPLALLTAVAGGVFGLDALTRAAPALALAYLGEEIAKTSMLAPLIARRDYRRSSLWVATEAVMSVVGPVLCLRFLAADTYGFLVGLLAARVVCFVGFHVAFFQGRYFSDVDLSAAASFVDRAARYAAPVSAMAPIGWVGAYFDRYAIGMTCGLAGAGVYSAVSGLVGRPYNVVTSVLTNYFRPLLFHDGAQASRRWLLAAACIGLAGAAAFALLGDVVARFVLAPEYRHGATGLMLFLAFAQTFVIMTHSADNALLAVGASGALLKMQVRVVFVSLAIVPAFAYFYGPLGAALGRLMAEAVKFVATRALLRRQACWPEAAERSPA